MPRHPKPQRVDPAIEPYLFELPASVVVDPGIDLGAMPLRVWTENKARLVARYLYYFELITKHGTYIDGFAGPQDPKRPEAWAAKLVMELVLCPINT